MKKTAVLLLTALVMTSQITPVYAKEDVSKIASDESEKDTDLSEKPFIPNDGIDKVSKYLSSTSNNPDGYYGRFIAKKDVILIGYNRNSTDDGFDTPGFYYEPKMAGKEGDLHNALDYADVEFNDNGTEDLEDDTFQVKKWYNILDDRKTDKDAPYLKDASYLNNWVEGNLKKLPVIKKHTSVTLPTLDCGNVSGVVVYSNKGDYIGTINLENDEAYKYLYDTSFMEDRDLKVELSKPVVNEDKTKASLHFDYDFSNVLPVFEDEILLDFKVLDSEGKTSLSGMNVAGLIDRKNLTKGTTKDFSLSTNGDYKLVVRTTSKLIEKNFSINGLAEFEPTTVDTTKPKLSYGKKPNGVLKGTPYSFTIYSDKDAVIMFNGESSGNPCKEYTFTVKNNGTYNVVATTKDGAETSETITIDGFVDSVNNIALNAYGDGGSSSLPQTGGIASVAVAIAGIFGIFGGIALVRKEQIKMFFKKRKKVSR